MKSTLPSTKSNLLKQKIDLTETRFPRAGEAGRAWKQIHRCSNTKLEPHYFVLILDTNLASLRVVQEFGRRLLASMLRGSVIFLFLAS